MSDEVIQELLEKAKHVLKNNDRRLWTVPASDLYPHQWLWDSCFISIGLRHLDIERAKTELISLLRGQWSNGMLAHIIFDSAERYAGDRRQWRSWLSPYAPDNISTSGLTQPPMLAEAVVRVGEKLKTTERRTWYKQMYGPLLASHEWIYNERNPHNEGLAILIHPYECGLDSTPPWLSELHKHSLSWWIAVIEQLHLDKLINKLRRDTKYVPIEQRMSNIDALGYWAALRRLRRKTYNSEAIISHSLFAVEDLPFNCILIRANEHLQAIAKTIGRELPAALLNNMELTQKALEQLWDETTGQYYSRSFVSHKLIEEPTIATLLPLYAGSISKERAKQLVELLKNRKAFGARWPVPSVPLNSPDFNPIRYWQGPTWINTNWLMIDGLERYGFNKEAADLRRRTLELVARSGSSEYFNPKTGQPAGAQNFSWTAALSIDLLNS
jgi:hypothetical protein